MDFTGNHEGIDFNGYFQQGSRDRNTRKQSRVKRRLTDVANVRTRPDKKGPGRLAIFDNKATSVAPFNFF